MTVSEIAERINAHLKRFEADPKINKQRFYKSSRTGKRESSGYPYYYANAVASGRWVRMQYIGYQGSTPLPRDEAERYLAWLDAGHVGTHYEAERAAKAERREGGEG